MSTRKDFGAPPPGYIAGVGRGAVGFTTRSDIGPARNDYGQTSDGSMAATSVAELSSYDESQFDKFSGYRQNLFAGIAQDPEDLKAEKVYEAIDNRMDSRRKIRREKLENEMKNVTLEVYELFQKDKKDLGRMSLEDWESIPEAGQQTKRQKIKSRAEKYTPIPDLIIQSAYENSVQNVDIGGSITPMNPNTGGITTPGTATPVNLMQLGHAREKVLDMTLGKLSDSVDGQTVVDPKGYLTDLRSHSFVEGGDVSDIEKARLLFRSITSTNPKSASGWIGSARLEEHVGKLSAARKIILNGCDACPDNEDIWVESSRLHINKNAKTARALVARGLKYIPHSEKLWLRASKLEIKRDSKRTILRKALQNLPGSVEIWKAAIELESEENARTLLSKAVQCVPGHVDFWLALARLESHTNARKVLNDARHNLPSEPRIWIAAARLEEANESPSVERLVKKALKSLQSHGVIIDRDYWIKAAYECEETNSPQVCKAIIKNVLHEGIEERDRRATWQKDAEAAAKSGNTNTARAIYELLVENFDKSTIWWDAAMLEKEKGSVESLIKLLEKAIKHCPKSDSLWLLLSKQFKEKKEIESARNTLIKAREANPESESICLAAVKFEFELKNDEKALRILRDSRESVNTARIWMKSALYSRELGKYDEEKQLLEEGVKRHPNDPKLWMMLGQNCERNGKYNETRVAYQKGLRNCPKSVGLWLCLSELEKRDASTAKARSLLETARLKLPLSVPLWIASIRLEEAIDRNIASRLLAKALKECPQSGEIWAYAIEFEPLAKQRGRCHDALKVLSEDPHVYLSAAKIFWRERKMCKAKNWFERAVECDPDNGDSWAYYTSFLRQTGTEEEQMELLNRCKKASPRHGHQWIKVSKKPGNLRLRTTEILKKVVEGIGM